MGEVYRAHDARLEREVALKVLPAQILTDEKARARMLREARMAGKLNHPHICTVHEVGEDDGQIYIAMELVEGKPLSSILGSGALPQDRALRYGEQVADALAHAHERGVLHRDLKSGNIVITPDGRAKVLDFGLAKPLAADDQSDAATTAAAPLTEPGSFLGTLEYMAPEQLRGQQADARSDIWALGVVLYEMVGGRRPFTGETVPAVSAAILKENHEPLQAEIPASLRAIIDRCLAKEPGERFQKTDEVRAALETAQSGGIVALPARPAPGRTRRPWLSLAVALVAMVAIVAATLVAFDVGGVRTTLFGQAGGGEEPVIRMAVLPFANLSGDPDQEYLSDGFTQEMITQLGRLHPEGLSVIARTSVMRYKGGDTPVDQIGRELGVDYVLEGSTLREDGLIRVSADLIHVEDQTQLWADSFERDLAGILIVQSEVAREVATALALELLPEEQARLASAPSVDPEAHEAYLRGTAAWQTLTPAGFEDGERFFEEAIQFDASHAPAYEGLAWIWAARNQMGVSPHSETAPLARATALQAVTLDDSSAGAHEILAAVRTWVDWDWAGAWPEWRRALELNPNGANAHAYYAHFLATIGRTEEAIPHSERAIELDPLNPLYQALYAVVLITAGRPEDGLAAANQALSMQPNHVLAKGAEWWAFKEMGMYDEMIADLRMLRYAADAEMLEALEEGLSEGGPQGAMRNMANLMAARYEASEGVVRPGYGPDAIVEMYWGAGELDRVVDWLEEAYRLHDPNLPYSLIPTGSRAPLRDNPRFQDLLRRMNMPPYFEGS
jgi:TolB-like protein